MKTKSVLLGTSVAIFFVIFAGLVFLPAILSSDRLKPRILKEVNQRLPGQLQVSQWKFKWFSGIEANGITYEHRQQNLLIKVVQLKGYRGLAQLIADTGNLGAVEVSQPVVMFQLADQKQPEAPQKTEPSSTPTRLPAFGGILKITDGSIRTVKADGSENVVIKDLDLFLDVSDLKKPIEYRLLMTSGDTIGRLAGEGTLRLSPDDPFNLNAIQSDGRLKITNWELEDALTILASRADYPSGKGRLDAELTLQGRATEKLDIKGQVSLNKLQLWGGPLGKDRPAVNRIDLELDGEIAQSALSLKQMAFQSSLANGSATASFSNQGQNRISGTADINLAEMFAQLPHTLKFREDTRLSEGKLIMSADIKTSDAVTTFDTSARIDKLKGVTDGKTISWNQPISVKARGQRQAQGIQLDNLSLRSSFLNGDGQGDLSNMQVTLSADLAKALGELKKFIDIKEWDGSGKLFAKLQVKETSPLINSAALNLDTRSLALSRNGRPILPKQDVKIDLATIIQRGPDLTGSEFQQPNLTIQSSMAKGKFSADSFKWNPEGKLPDADNLSIDANFDLQQITSLLRNFNKISKNTQLAGSAHIQTSGSIKGQQLLLKSTRVDTRNFRYREGSKSIEEDRLTVQTAGKIDFNTKSLVLAPVEINGSPGDLTIPELAVSDWSNFQKDMKTQATANLDLAKLISAYGDFIQLPEKTRMSGKGTFDLDMDFSSKQEQFLKVRADLAPFRLTSETLPSIAEDQVKLTADLKRKPKEKVLVIENIQLNSTPLSISAAGNLDQTGQGQTLDAAGSINLDLKMLSPYLEKIVGPQQITITGRGDNPFKLKMTSGGDRWTDSLKQTEFTGAIRADSIDAFGLGISATEIPIRVANESAVAKLAATANGGQLNLQPTLNLQKEPYMLSLPQDTFILKDVEITDAIAERLMSKLHPVFQGSVQAEGHVDLYMQHFSWPLDNKDRDKTTFAGTLHLKGVRINSTKLLTGLLTLVGVRGNEMDFGDLDIDFVARNGRIETSPIRLEIDGYPIELRGSVGFDKSLDYIAKLPITPKLVGNKAYTYLEGVTIDVPIRGNSSNPDIDKGTMQKASASLAEQALQKTLEKGVQNLFEQIIKKK
jgi:hypothetical protein